MKKYLLETSFIISFLRGQKETVELLGKLEDELSSSFVCLAELYEGIFKTKEKEKAEKTILGFFSGLSEVYGLDEEITKEFGRVRNQLRIKGEMIEDLDILIAATCLAHRLTLVTLNLKHFKRIKNLDILAT